MKFSITNLPPSGDPLCGRSAPVSGRSPASKAPGTDFSHGLVWSTPLRPGRAHSAGFTMIEIAICLAIIGFALVAIIGVLPLGMHTQRDNREETIINQDATVLLEAIRNGARGSDDLTNFVYAITNYVTSYDKLGKVIPPASRVAGYTYLAASFNGAANGQYLTNATRIIGVLSTPEYTDGFGGPPMNNIFNQNFTSNHVVAYVRSISGLAAEKPPQDNQIMLGDALTYRMYCVNAPMPVATNDFTFYAQNMAANQRELRLTFLWPQYPNGKLGPGKQTFRTTIAGQLARTNYYFAALYFYQSQQFNNAP